MRKIIFGLFVVILLAGCAGQMNPTTDSVKTDSIKNVSAPTDANKSNVTVNNVTIAQIKSDPSKFVGEVVVIHGVYMGWMGNESPPVTRSDWAIDDGTGMIYVTGKYPKLDPIRDVGKNVTVIGYVRVLHNRVYIEAVKVESE